ncbi:hypothetical protein JXB27_00525 [Candidatus Woesearchaeota archaeon]|nr:hypothetical protein [Candidatus Woesearchaeota archaeon]
MDAKKLMAEAEAIRQRAMREKNAGEKSRLLDKADHLERLSEKVKKEKPDRDFDVKEKKKSSHKGLILLFFGLIAYCIYSIYQITKVSMDAKDIVLPVGVILISAIILFKLSEHK